MFLAITPLNDVGRWARSSLLEIVLFVVGSVLLTRLATWTSQRVTERIDARAAETDSVVRTEAAKHRHAVIAVVTWTFLVLVYCITAVLVIRRLGIPVTSLVAPATVAGVAVGFGAQRL
ncbi:MAG TPA: mechanosensitive ion channel family protein, partial [Mycobacterium sp.]|nr:mechanosensitive ion channel family protein [Mycobacterium sp.]